MRKVTKLWRCKDGRKIRICDMDDGHLANCIALLERAADKIRFTTPYPCFNGEMAQFFAEQDWDRLQSAGTEEFFPIYVDMLDEQERRKILLQTKP